MNRPNQIPNIQYRFVLKRLKKAENKNRINHKDLVRTILLLRNYYQAITPKFLYEFLKRKTQIKPQRLRAKQTIIRKILNENFNRQMTAKAEEFRHTIEIYNRDTNHTETIVVKRTPLNPERISRTTLFYL